MFAGQNRMVVDPAVEFVGGTVTGVVAAIAVAVVAGLAVGRIAAVVQGMGSADMIAAELVVAANLVLAGTEVVVEAFERLAAADMVGSRPAAGRLAAALPLLAEPGQRWPKSEAPFV